MFKIPETYNHTYCNSFHTSFDKFENLYFKTFCNGHSEIKCHMINENKAYYCIANNAYQKESEWHLYCNPTNNWDGNLNGEIFKKTFSINHNHFLPNIVHKNVKPYIFVHPVNTLPPSITYARNSVAYILNGDSVVEPMFNPWHGLADPLNFFTVQKILNKTNYAHFNNITSIYPSAGCDGMRQGKGNWGLWKTLAKSKIYPCTKDLEKHGKIKKNKNLVAIKGLILSPQPWGSPIWYMSSFVRRCPHQSQLFFEFRKHVTLKLDVKVPSIVKIIKKIKSAPSTILHNEHNYQNIIYIIRRSSVVKSKYKRVLVNIEELAKKISETYKNYLILLVNPSEISFLYQYALFRISKLIIGTHGAHGAFGIFLTPNQFVLELPLPGSPGLHDWLFATMGAKTLSDQACFPNTLKKCTRDIGYVNITHALTRIDQLFHQKKTWVSYVG